MMHFHLAPFAFAPFPHGQGTGVFDIATYLALVQTWPSEETFKVLGGPYRKLALSERCNPEQYVAWITKKYPWRLLYGYIKSASFREHVFESLAGYGVPRRIGQYSSRFEFSSLPSEGGAIAPHRDIPSKVLTIVVPMTLETVPGWGTDILEPLGQVGNDYETPRDAFRTVTSFDYAPNTCGIFVKTADSWHAIGPLKGPAGQFRRSLTLNVELTA